MGREKGEGRQKIAPEHVFVFYDAIQNTVWRFYFCYTWHKIWQDICLKVFSLSLWCFLNNAWMHLKRPCIVVLSYWIHAYAWLYSSILVSAFLYFVSGNIVVGRFVKILFTSPSAGEAAVHTNEKQWQINVNKRKKLLLSIDHGALTIIQQNCHVQQLRIFQTELEYERKCSYFLAPSEKTQNTSSLLFLKSHNKNSSKFTWQIKIILSHQQINPLKIHLISCHLMSSVNSCKTLTELLWFLLPFWIAKPYFYVLFYLKIVWTICHKQ